MRNKHLMAITPWSKEESEAFDLYIAQQDARIQAMRERHSFL
jgi:hypothetical protein